MSVQGQHRFVGYAQLPRQRIGRPVAANPATRLFVF
jgi:hypothetical protein